jgi:hypothetical protein
VRCDEELGLLAVCVDSLRDENNANARELKLLEDPERIDEFAAQPAGVVDEDHVEHPWFFFCGCEQPL